MWTKKILYLLIGAGFLFPVSAISQIAINTENPQPGTLLYIDPLKNDAPTGVPTAAQTPDNIVVSATGNMGIGTITPTTKLHVVTGGTPSSPNPQLRIESGSVSADDVLTCDAQGRARWATYAPGAVIGTFSPTGVSIPGIQSTFSDTGSRISLDPGTWVIIYTIILDSSYGGVPPAGYKLWMRSSIGDAVSGNNISSDVFGNIHFSNNVIVGRKGTITGRCLINNQTTIAKDYHILVGNIDNPMGLTGVTVTIGAAGNSGSFYAFRVKL